LTLRVLIADDQALVRAGFRLILESQQDFEVVGEAGDGKEAIATAERVRPDLILMDIRMPAVNGLEAARQILAAGGGSTRVVMLTTFDLDEYVYAALRAGASGFLLKDVTPEALIAAVRTVAGGDALLGPSITRRLIERYVTGDGSLAKGELAQLTPRELEVLRLMARGLANHEIADTLKLSESTIKTHVAHILDKLQLDNRVQAVVVAYESGLVRPGEIGKS
jgi:DNA-binding NarL/FixJ family response regulator